MKPLTLDPGRWRPGCTRPSGRVRIETQVRATVVVKSGGCTRPSGRVRIETSTCWPEGPLTSRLHPPFGAGED